MTESSQADLGRAISNGRGRMRKLGNVLTLLLLLALVIGAIGCGGETGTATPTLTLTPAITVTPTITSTPTPTPTPTLDFAEVARVIDGDTIELVGGERVRYIGIDTPEVGECYYQEATDKNIQLVEGQTIRLEKDVSETDRYDRLLRFVYVDELFVNAELVRLGYAEAYPYPPDTKYAHVFAELEEEAIAEGRGIHGACVTTIPTPQGNCDPAYPDVCIPLYPPDLDCGDISYKNFRVLPPDPHGFDGDNDGIGCES